MKKSEMVIKIAECLIEPHFPDDPIREAEYILTKLEEFGMLPPMKPIPEYAYQAEHEWESEDL